MSATHLIPALATTISMFLLGDLATAVLKRVTCSDQALTLQGEKATLSSPSSERILLPFSLERSPIVTKALYAS